MKNFSPAWLFQFQLLHEVGSFTETALKLNLSQQALSKNIQALETWAGQPLLQRLPGRLELTPAGVLLREAIPELLQSLQQAHQSVHTPISTVHVGAYPLWSPHYLDTALLATFENWPDLDLQVSPLLAPDISSFLLAGELDLGLSLCPPGEGLQGEALPELRWVLAVHPELAELRPFPYLLHADPHAVEAFHDDALLPQPARCLGRIGSWSLLRELLLARVGGAFVLWPYVREDLAAGRLNALPTPPLPTVTPWAIWLEGLELHPASRELINCLQREMRL